MSKYNSLWAHIGKCDVPSIVLIFAEIDEIAGATMDHSFLKYKKELVR